MAFSVVQSAAGTPVTNSTASTSLGSSVTKGNAVVVHVSWTATLGTLINVVDNFGNSYLLQGSVPAQGNSESSALLVAFNVTGGSSFTVTATLDSSQTGLLVSVFEVTGLSGEIYNNGPRYVNSTTFSITSTGSTTLPWISGAGNLIGIALNVYPDTSLTDTSVTDSVGNTYTLIGHVNQASGIRLALYACYSITVPGSGSITVTVNVTVTVGGGGIVGNIFEFSPGPAGYYFSGTDGSTSASSGPGVSPLTCPAIATTQARDLIIAIGSGGNVQSDTGTWAPGWISLGVNAAWLGDIFAYEVAGPAGSYTPSATFTSNAGYGMFAQAVKCFGPPPVASNTQTATTTPTCGSVTTAVASSVILAAGRGGTLSAGSGYTLVAGTNLEYQVVGPGTYAGNFTQTSSTFSGSMAGLALGANAGFNPWVMDSIAAIEFADSWALVLGNILNYEYTQPWTATALVKPPIVPPGGTSGAGLIFSNAPYPTTAYPGYEFWIDGSGFLHVRIIHDFNIPAYIGVVGTTNICDGNWHYVAATYSGSGTAAGVKIYLDGVAQSTTTESDTLGGLSIIASGQNIIVGNQIGWESYFQLRGYLADFSIANVARSAGYISTYSYASPPPIDANTQLYLKFNEGSGPLVYDSSSHFGPFLIPNFLSSSAAIMSSSLLAAYNFWGGGFNFFDPD